MATTIQKYTKKAILGAIETSYGVATALTPASAILAAKLEITPLETETTKLEYDMPYKGNTPTIMTARKSTIKFDVYLVGSGTAGTPPPWGFLLRACSMAEVISATKVEYLPISDAEESAYFEVSVDKTVHAILGARGTVVIKLDAKEVPMASFTFEGLFTDPIAQSNLPSVNYSAFKNPQGALTGQTTDFKINNFTAPLKMLELDVSNELVHANLIGYEEVISPKREPKGSLSFICPTITELDWGKLVQSPDGVPLQITHDNRAGYKVSIKAPNVQLTEAKYADQDGILMLETNLTYLPKAGNDEFAIICE